jgi:hypothetical protein
MPTQEAVLACQAGFMFVPAHTRAGNDEAVVVFGHMVNAVRQSSIPNARPFHPFFRPHERSNFAVFVLLSAVTYRGRGVLVRDLARR